MKKNCRVYKIAESKKERDALGIWQGIKDSITFICFDDKLTAELYAQELLKNTAETCIALEDIKHKILKIIYRDKTEVLTSYQKATNKKELKAFKAINKNYTLEATKRGFIAFAYSAEADEIDNTCPLCFAPIVYGNGVYCKNVEYHINCIRKQRQKAGFISLQAVFGILIIGAIILAVIIGHGIILSAKSISDKHNALIEDVLQ